MAKQTEKKICDVCGGSGMVSYFKGVSRFLLSNDECPACCGLGYELTVEKNDKGSKRNDNDTSGNKGMSGDE